MTVALSAPHVVASMVSPQILRGVLLVELAVVVVAVATVAVHGMWLCRRERSDAPRLRHGRLVLAAAVDSDLALDEEGLAQLRRLPRRVQRQVVQQLAVSVTGEEGRRTARIAESLGLVATAERRCRSRWWWRRLQGAHQLNVYGHDGSLLGLFDDPHPAVRAQVIEWAGDSGREDVASRLVAALQDSAPLCRHAAADSILRSGAPMLDAIASELSGRSGGKQAELLEVMARRPDARYHQASVNASAAGRPDIRAAAAGILGGVGGHEAASVLLSLLADTDHTVRAAAAEGLRKLGHREAAPDLAPLLRDPSFVVRRTAGAALADLGPGGILLLRHYLSDEDPFAADMARYSLDVAALRPPGTTGAAR